MLPENAKSFFTDAVLTCLNPHQTTDEVKTSAEIKRTKLIILKHLQLNFIISIKLSNHLGVHNKTSGAHVIVHFDEFGGLLGYFLKL
jgi:hypothetical protein